MTKEQQEAQDRFNTARRVASEMAPQIKAARKALREAEWAQSDAWYTADAAADEMVRLGMPDPRNVP